jgi:hypothetical protein
MFHHTELTSAEGELQGQTVLAVMTHFLLQSHIATDILLET